VPVTVVTDRAQADLTLEGFAESESTKQTRITMKNPIQEISVRLGR
jgi:hypothetical protein